MPAIAEYTFRGIDEEFVARAKAAAGGIIVAGSNYGQGSSREHAALAPMFLGVRVVVALSFARIHLANLVNCGILPLTFANRSDYDAALSRGVGDEWEIAGVRSALDAGGQLVIHNRTSGSDIPVQLGLSRRRLAELSGASEGRRETRPGLGQGLA